MYYYTIYGTLPHVPGYGSTWCVASFTSNGQTLRGERIWRQRMFVRLLEHEGGVRVIPCLHIHRSAPVVRLGQQRLRLFVGRQRLVRASDDVPFPSASCITTTYPWCSPNGASSRTAACPCSTAISGSRSGGFSSRSDKFVWPQRELPGGASTSQASVLVQHLCCNRSPTIWYRLHTIACIP
jgi:hypothetical protein